MRRWYNIPQKTKPYYPNRRVDTINFGVTKAKEVYGCDCDELPWEDCEHTAVLEPAQLEHMRAISCGQTPIDKLK